MSSQQSTLIDDISPILATLTHGYIYKQHHATTKKFFKRYMVQYKCFIFYWATEQQCLSHHEKLFTALANTTLPQYQQLLSLYYDSPFDFEAKYRGAMTPSVANKVLSKHKGFDGVYILHGYDITRSTTYLKIAPPNAMKVHVLSQIDASDYNPKLTQNTPPSSITDPHDAVLYPISFAALVQGQFRVINLAFPSEPQRDYWIALLQQSSNQLITPRLTPFLKNLTLPPKFVFGDIRIQQDLRTFLISNRYALFDVHEQTLGYYYTGSMGLANVSAYDAYTHCILLTTHRIIRINNNEVVFNFPYSNIDTVLFYSHSQTDSRRSLGLMNSVRYICNTQSSQYNNDQLFLVTALKGIGKGLTSGFKNSAASIYSTINPWSKQSHHHTTPALALAPAPPAPSIAGSSTVQIAPSASSRSSTHSIPTKFWFLDETMIPEIKTLDKRTYIILQLTTGQRVPIELTKHKQYDIFFANLLSKILVMRHLVSMYKERYASGVYNSTLRLWPWTLSRYLSILNRVVLPNTNSTTLSLQHQQTLADNSPQGALSLLNITTSLHTVRPAPFHLNAIQSEESTPLPDPHLVVNSSASNNTTNNPATFHEYLTPDLITGYIDFSGGPTRLSQNLITIAYQQVLQSYYKDGVLIRSKHEDIQNLNKSLQTVSALEEFYRDDVNYIVAGDHGMLVLDAKPIGNPFQDKYLDIPALVSKKEQYEKNMLASKTSLSLSNLSPQAAASIAPFYLPFTLDKGLNEIASQLQLDSQQQAETLKMIQKEKKQCEVSRTQASGDKNAPFGRLQRQPSKRALKKHKKKRAGSLLDEFSDSDSADDIEEPTTIMGGFATRSAKSTALRQDRKKNVENGAIPEEISTQTPAISQPPSQSISPHPAASHLVVNNPETPINTVSLAHGNASVSKYTPGYQYEYVLSDFSGHTSQQWKWNEEDQLWPFHSTYVPSYFEESAESEEDQPNTQKDVAKRATNTNHGRYKVGDVIIDEVWQNQRFYPFYRWSSNLLPNDRPSWSTDAGVARSVVDANRELPQGWEWVDSQWNKVSNTNTSSEGWIYGTELTAGVKEFEKKCNSAIHVVRKRQWTRRRQLVELIVEKSTKDEKKDKVDADGNPIRKIKFGEDSDNTDDEDDHDAKTELQNQQRMAEELLKIEYNRSLESAKDLDQELIEMQQLANYTQSEFATAPKQKSGKKGVASGQQQQQIDDNNLPLGAISSKPGALDKSILQRGMVHGHGIFVEYLYENQQWKVGVGWRDGLYPVTTKTPTVVAKQHPQRIPRDKWGNEVGKWSSDDWTIVLSDKHFILPGYGYRWVTPWLIDKCIDGDDGYWQYTRGSYDPMTAMLGKNEWCNHSKVGAHYRRRRWVRYKEYIIDKQFVPKQIYPMIIKFEQNDTISLQYAHNASDSEQLQHKKQQEELKNPRKVAAQKEKNCSQDDDWDMVSDQQVDTDRYLLTIKGLFSEYGVSGGQSAGAHHFESGSLVFLQSEAQSRAIQEHERSISMRNQEQGGTDPLDESESSEDDRADVSQRWSVLGVDSLYLERFILPLIHQCDIAREEDKAVFSIMSIYDPENSINPSCQSTLQYHSIIGSPSLYPITHSSSSHSNSNSTSLSSLGLHNTHVQLFKTLGYKTMNEDAHFGDEQEILTEQVNNGSSDISYYNRNKHYLAPNFHPYAPSMKNPQTLGAFSQDLPFSQQQNPLSQATSNTLATTPTTYIDYLSQSISKVPSGHLAALLQLWLEQSQYACLHNNVSWVNRVPPPLLYFAFKDIMRGKLIDNMHPLPPVPFTPSYCYHHSVIWSNTHFSIYMPNLPQTRPAKAPNDISASKDQYICFGDAIINNGKEVRSLVYKDHPLFLPPVAFRLIHVMIDTDTIPIFSTEQQVMFEQHAAGHNNHCQSANANAATVAAASSGFATTVSPLSRTQSQIAVHNSALGGSTGYTVQMPLLIYELIPPVGYVSLGLVARTTRPTSTHLYRCVPQEFVSVPTEHRQDDLALTLPIPSLPTASSSSAQPQPCPFPPPTSLRMFSNADNYSRSDRTGRVVNGFEKTAETLTSILADDETYNDVVAAKDSTSTLQDGDNTVSPQERQFRHPWATRVIKSSNLNVIDEAIANGVLAEALRDLAQFDNRDKDHDQRTVLQNVIDAVSKRRGNQALSSQIAFSALEKHQVKVKQTKSESDTDSDDEIDALCNKSNKTLPNLDESDDEAPYFVYQAPTTQRTKLGDLAVDNLRLISRISTKPNRSQWNLITEKNSKANASSRKLKANEIVGATVPYSKELANRGKNQHKGYYSQRKQYMAKKLGRKETKQKQRSVRFTAKKKEDEGSAEEGDNKIDPTFVRVKTQEEEEIDAEVPDYTADLPKEGQKDAAALKHVSNTNNSNTTLHSPAPAAGKARRGSTLAGAIALKTKAVPKTDSQRANPLGDIPTASLLGTIFERKIERVVYPTLTLPYFRSNNLPLLPTLNYVHSTIEELTMETSKFGVDDNALDEDGLPAQSPTDFIPQETQSRRLVTYNSLIPRLTNNANTVAFWTLPSNTFTMTTGQNEPVNIRLGMGNVKPTATWCGELWMHTHTLEILLCGVVTRRLYYRRKWEQYQQKLIELERQEEDEKIAKVKARKKKKEAKQPVDAQGIPITDKDILRDSIKARRLGHRLYAGSSDDEDRKSKKKRNKNRDRNDLDSMYSGSSDSEAEDFYEKPIDLEEIERQRLLEEKIKNDQEKFKRFYDSDDEDNLINAKGRAIDDSDDDRFNFISDDIALRKRFLFDSETETDSETEKNSSKKDSNTNNNNKSLSASKLTSTNSISKKDQNLKDDKPAGNKSLSDDEDFVLIDEDGDVESTAKPAQPTKPRKFDDLDGSDDTDVEAEVLAMTSGLFGDQPQKALKKSKKPKRNSKLDPSGSQKPDNGDNIDDTDTNINDEDDDVDEDDESASGKPEQSKSTKEPSVSSKEPSKAEKRAKNIVIPGVDIEFGALFTPGEDDDKAQANDDDDNLGDQTDVRAAKSLKASLQPVKYDYLSPKTIYQLLPPMIAMIKHYSLHARQLLIQYNAIPENKPFSLPPLCLTCYATFKQQQIDQFQEEMKKEQQQRSVWSSLSSSARKQHRESDENRKRELQVRLHQFEEFERLHHNYLQGGIMFGNISLNITPFNFEYISITSIATVFTPFLYIPCTCGAHSLPPSMLPGPSPFSSPPTTATATTLLHNNSSLKLEEIPESPRTSSLTLDTSIPTPHLTTSITSPRNTRNIYDVVDKVHAAEDPSPRPSSASQVPTPHDSFKSESFKLTPQFQFPQNLYNLTQFSALSSSSPPYLCPMTPFEHVACLLWLLSQASRLCQQIRVSILEDLLYEGLQNSGSIDRVGSLVSLLIKWETVLDFIPPLSYVDTYICNHLLKKYNCAVPKRMDLLINQPFKTYIYNRCLDLVTHRFVLTISPALNAWDKVRNYIYTNPVNSVSSPTTAGSSTLLRGGTFKQKNQRYINPNKDSSMKDLLPQNSTSTDFNDILTKETLAYDLITGQRVGDGGSSDDENEANSTAKELEKQQLLAAEAEENNTKGQIVSDADLAAEFAVDMGLTLVESSTQEQQLGGVGNKTREEQKQQILQQLLIAMSSLIHDLLAVQRVGKKRLSIFKLFLFTYNDLILQILHESLHVDILVLAEKASVGEWLDSYDQLLKSITSFITVDTLNPITPEREIEMVRTGTYKHYQDLLQLRPVILDVLHKIRTMRLTYVTEYLNVVKTNINHMFENILMTETSLLPRYQAYDNLAQFTGHFETFSPTDVYEILQTFCNSMLKQFRLFPIFNQTISVLSKRDFLNSVLNTRIGEARDSSNLGEGDLPNALLTHGQHVNMEQVLYDFTQLRITINNNPVDYEQLQDKYILITKLFDVLSQTQSYYFSALVLHLDRILQRVIANKGGINDPFKPAQLFEQKTKGFFGTTTKSTLQLQPPKTMFAPQAFQSHRDHILSILDLPSASKLFTQAVTDMQKYVDENSISVKKKQSIGPKSLQLQYIFSNTVNSSAKSKIAQAVTNTSSVSTIPLPHIYIIGHMNNVWDYLQHRNGLIERFQNVYHDINNHPEMKKVLAYVKKSIVQMSSRSTNIAYHDEDEDTNGNHGDTDSDLDSDLERESPPTSPLDPLSFFGGGSTSAPGLRFNTQSELRSQYSSFTKFFNALLERESDQVENAIYNIYYKSHDILVAQCHFTIHQLTNKLFTNEWWTTAGLVNEWLDAVHIQFYNSFIGLHIDAFNVSFVKQYMRKIVKNISYMYISRFLASFYHDKKKPDFITNLLKGTKLTDYSFEILLDKIFNDIQAIISFCTTLQTRLPPNISHLYENDLNLKDTTRIDTILLAQLFVLCEYNTETVITNFDELYNNITGTKYICEQVVSALYSPACIVTIGSLVHVLFSLKGMLKSKVTNTLAAIIQLCNKVAQTKLQTIQQGKQKRLNQQRSSDPNAPPGFDRRVSQQLGYQIGEDDDEDEYESIFKHSSLRLYVLVEYGRGLAPKNTDGVTSDPYVVVKLMQGRIGGADASKVMEKKRTKAIPANINPDWYEFVSFDPSSLLFTDSLELHIYDSNWLSRDTSMGSVRISRHSIEQRSIQTRKNIKDLRRNFDDKFALKREEMLKELENKYSCSIWGYCTEKFALTIPNRGNLTCTFILAEDK